VANRRKYIGATPIRQTPKVVTRESAGAFELTRQAIGYRMLQLLALPLETLDRTALQAALEDIGRS
jgi:hypothetical protein